MNKKRIIIVDKNDNEVGLKLRSEIDEETDIYRCTGIWINDPEGNILLAQRSFSKRHDPGKWGAAAAGTVEEGETYESNAIKELQEELGLSDVRLVAGPKIFSDTGKRFFGQWFFATIDRDTKLSLQVEEVESVKWISKEEFLTDIKTNPESYVPSLNSSIRLF